MIGNAAALTALLGFAFVPPALAQGVRPGERIVFLGDSITDQGGYFAPLAERLGKDATLVNRGLNGAIASDIVEGAAIFGDEQPPLVEVLFEDRPTVVVIFRLVRRICG